MAVAARSSYEDFHFSFITASNLGIFYPYFLDFSPYALSLVFSSLYARIAILSRYSSI
jgi:hypothetical protein